MTEDNFQPLYVHRFRFCEHSIFFFFFYQLTANIFGLKILIEQIKLSEIIRNKSLIKKKNSSGTSLVVH